MNGDVSAVYQIKLWGRLDPCWSDWLGGMTITHQISADSVCITTVTGRVPDQAALRGILWWLWDLNLTLISVNPVTTEDGRRSGTVDE